MTSAKAKLVLQPLFLKDADELSEWALPLNLEGTKKERVDFLRKMEERLGREKVLLCKKGRQKRALLMIEPALFGRCGLRARLWPDKTGAFAVGEIEEVIEAIFEREKEAFDLQLCLSQEAVADLSEKQKESARTIIYAENSRGQPQQALCLHVFRAETAKEAGLLVKLPFASALLFANQKGTAISSLQFLMDKAKPGSRREENLLLMLGQLDEQGDYHAEWEIKDPRPQRVPDILHRAAGEIEEYVRGERRLFDLPLEIETGSVFQRKIWKTLADIPYGVTLSYEDLAAQALGSRKKGRAYARATGAACAANPIALFIPCHRVIGSSGHLVGFSGGVDVKSALLNLELFNFRKAKE